MSQQVLQGINRQGLDAAFEAEEERKARLILSARLLRERQQDEAAAAEFAQAAEIESRLAAACESQGLLEKSFRHRFSAAGCWAQAGNFYQAIAICADLLVRADLPDRLRQQVQDYVAALRERRTQWYKGLVLEMAGSGL